MAAFVNLLGPTLSQNNDGNRFVKYKSLKTEEALKGKNVGLFFAASWRARLLASAGTWIVCIKVPS